MLTRVWKFELTRKGIIAITLPKETPGQDFKELDLLTLLTPKAPGLSNALIQEIGESTIATSDEVIDWNFPQILPNLTVQG